MSGSGRRRSVSSRLGGSEPETGPGADDEAPECKRDMELDERKQGLQLRMVQGNGSHLGNPRDLDEGTFMHSWMLNLVNTRYTYSHQPRRKHSSAQLLQQKFGDCA